MPDDDSEQSPTDGRSERTVATSLDRRNFLRSTAAAAFVSGGFSTHATAQTRTFTVSQPANDTGDLAGEPVYEVGIDRGFYAWIADDTFHLRWTGDTRTTDQVYVVAHDVRTDGTFGDPSRVRFEDPEDYLGTTTDSRISGRAAVGGSEDGYDVPLADATTVELDLQFSGPIGKNTWRAKSGSEKLETVQQTTTTRDPDVVFLGSDRSTPATLPATVSVSTTYEVTSLSGDRPIEEFYGASSQFSSTRLEEPETSHLFLYDGPNGLSLVVIHDAPTDGEDGAVSFDFTGLPTAEGQWVVQDEGGDFDSSTDTSVDWRWPAYPHKDGGAWRGGLDDSFSVTIDPLFNGDARRGPQYDEIKRWRFLSGDPSSPDRLPLDMSQPVTISTGHVQQPPGGSVDLDALMGAKRDSITNVRNASGLLFAGPGDPNDDGVPWVSLPEPPTTSSVDSGAEAFLDTLEDDLDGLDESEREQYAEAIERLLAVEDVTETAVRGPVRQEEEYLERLGADPSDTRAIIRQEVDAVNHAITTLAVEVLTAGIGRAASGSLKWAVDTDVMQNVFRSARSIRHQGPTLARASDDASEEAARSFDELEEYQSELARERADAQDNFLSTGPGAMATQGPKAHPDYESTMKGTFAPFRQYQERWLFASHLNREAGPFHDATDILAADLPSVDLPDIPDRLPVPGAGHAEDASNTVSGWIDDAADHVDQIDYEHDDIDLPEYVDLSDIQLPDKIELEADDVPGFSALEDLDDALDDLSGAPIGGVDFALDTLVEEIEEAATAGELADLAADAADDLVELAEDAMDELTGLTHAGMDLLDALRSILEVLDAAAGFLLLVGAVLAFISTGGLGILVAVPFLEAFSLAITGLTLLVDEISTITGMVYRDTLTSLHNRTGHAIVTGNVDIGGN